MLIVEVATPGYDIMIMLMDNEVMFGILMLPMPEAFTERQRPTDRPRGVSRSAVFGQKEESRDR
jgi:hypothetical protein